ncbi:acyltransferase family protein [Tepidamorphus sp. 3E244]|uniref:acyltransferase family protein n=1 Tax=Tepidamorphus sp. 3E244 TaxID=3385498 RepID=UPI0038FBE765
MTANDGISGMGGATDTRVPWVDTAKGICIALVVMMHSTLGVEALSGQTGWLGEVVAFAQPFRMPDFFLVSALFLAARIDAPWRLYFDRKVLHFVYFYLLWTAIQMGFKVFTLYDGDLGALALGYLQAMVQPFGILWFIYLLAIFFVVTRALRAVPPLVVFAAAAALEMAPIETGWIVVDEFAARFVYFYVGYVLARHIFAFAGGAGERPMLGVAGLVAWALINGAAVYGGVSTWPGIGLALGFAGAIAITVLASMIAQTLPGRALAYAGARSIAIYLAFFLPMAVARSMLLKTGVIPDVGTVSALVTLAGCLLPLAALAIVKDTPLSFLFERPAWARIVPAARAKVPPPGAAGLTPAE